MVSSYYRGKVLLAAFMSSPPVQVNLWNFVLGQMEKVISQTNTRSSLASDHNKWGTGMRQASQDSARHSIARLGTSGSNAGRPAEQQLEQPYQLPPATWQHCPAHGLAPGPWLGERPPGIEPAGRSDLAAWDAKTGYQMLVQAALTSWLLACQPQLVSQQLNGRQPLKHMQCKSGTCLSAWTGPRVVTPKTPGHLWDVSRVQASCVLLHVPGPTWVPCVPAVCARALTALCRRSGSQARQLFGKASFRDLIPRTSISSTYICRASAGAAHPESAGARDGQQ